MRGVINQYNRFNLIVANSPSKTIVYISSRLINEGQAALIQEVYPGLHMLSNAKLDSPRHKVFRNLTFILVAALLLFLSTWKSLCGALNNENSRECFLKLSDLKQRKGKQRS